MKEKVIDVSIPFECPFNVGFACVLDDNIAFQLECGDNIPAECPLILADYKIHLVKDRKAKE